ncbi:RNB domain-containing ribonuclease [Agrococcus sp. SGAir0287]|uniref:RNB domain-containing ribonuclease n=1 Tax=Agrococcus sp. SGAir0287 TaxID=2070347 RepID=UPI0010CCB97B|nr:RNB domain-containing ribonuclease [Agrococcus sp. SGAir0287]QCR19648.1 ribonuclease II [Agrococcus sp. SGAir0287]
MPLRQQRLRADAPELTAALAAIRADLGAEEAFPAPVEAEAARAAHRALEGADRTDVPFVTIDPEGSTDLDQALAIEADGAGHVVRYAIADVPAFVEPGGAVDAEARRRGQTLYAPDARVPLHPTVLSEDAASLLPDRERQALVWTFVLDADGAVRDTSLERARVRSREQLSYPEAQARIEAGDTTLGMLRVVGERRIALEAARDGASLDTPDEEVVHDERGWRIERRAPLPVEQWNAQISLMTGMEAARLQLAAGEGVLRTMPRPPKAAIADFRRATEALGVPWRPSEHYGAFLRRLDRALPTTVVILAAARRLFRGADYLVLDGRTPGADAVVQAAIGAPYAHATAPLRRLVDRVVLAHCEAIANGRDVPAWATAAARDVPEAMRSSGSRAAQLERESLQAVAAWILADRVGETIDALVVERRDDEAVVLLVDPPVEVRVATAAEPATRIRVRVRAASVADRSIVLDEA